MKYFYVRYEVADGYPDYEFVIKAESFEEAKEIATEIIDKDYEQEWEDNKNFAMYEITAEQLLERMLIN